MMNDTLQLNAGQEKVVTPWHAVEASVVMHTLGVDPKRGLTASDVASRQRSFGRNTEEGVGSRRITAFLVFLFIGIAIGFIFTAAVLNRVAGNNIEAVSLLIVIAVGSIVGFAYVLKAARALDAMHDAAHASIRVRRDGKQMKLEAEQLVPGDIVVLEAGDAVPADARLIEADQLQVRETVLTGMNAVVEKDTSSASDDAPLDQRRSMVYFGTALNSGSGVAVVVATGSRTELGKIANFAA
jgi:Cation transport ATPase